MAFSFFLFYPCYFYGHRRTWFLSRLFPILFLFLHVYYTDGVAKVALKDGKT